MRRSALVLVFAVAVLSARATTAQTEQPKTTWKIQSVTVSSGEDAISSGITGIMDLAHGSASTQIAVQQEQAWLVFGKNVKLGKLEMTFAGSTGHQQGAPWYGPYFAATLPLGKHASLSTMQWPCFFFWEPRPWKNDGVKNPESVLVGYLGSIAGTVGPLEVNYAWLNFLDDPWNKLPGIALNHRFDQVKVRASATRNWNKKSWMFYVGATYYPK